MRSCAVAGLGQKRQTDEPAKILLLNSLKDKDPRVRANAIEALQQCGWQDAQRLIELTEDIDNRVRANAIKALLSVRVEAAQPAIESMLNDRRARHRRSARWVLESIREGWKISEVKHKQNIKYPDSAGVLVKL